MPVSGPAGTLQTRYVLPDQQLRSPGFRLPESPHSRPVILPATLFLDHPHHVSSGHVELIAQHAPGVVPADHDLCPQSHQHHVARGRGL